MKPEQIHTVSLNTTTSDRNDSVKILNHGDSFLPNISASSLKCNYAFGEEYICFASKFIMAVSIR